ncbi:M23 family metallopeptidase [Cohnella massiliensis]|uniref:M23 family metallopeptidase n=1 Tax=Cohnella massiliensis TaxID=1816691 RepID=UPI0009BA1FF5|nr:M23 family metallopeptidase [Cohnella massiliensis]
MNEQNNKNTRKVEESIKPVAASTPVKPTGWKRLLSRRWVFPAAYMAAAAIIVTILWVNSGGDGKDASQTVSSPTEVAGEEAGSEGQEAAEAAANGETLRWPVSNKDEMVVKLPFYDASGSEEQRAAAMVQYNDTFMPHTAVDLGREDNETFEVLAAMSGLVKVAEQNTINGYEVRIEHPNGLVTVYQSLADVKVQAGDEVEQGDVIAMAGQSEIGKDEGVHVHFEVLDNGQSVNPDTLIKEEH